MIGQVLLLQLSAPSYYIHQPKRNILSNILTHLAKSKHIIKSEVLLVNTGMQIQIQIQINLLFLKNITFLLEENTINCSAVHKD
jgi:hypothetical protein